jgi:TusA-related sulfurtransferase
VTDEGAVLLLDCRGMRCPLPIIRLAQRFGEVPVGGVVALTADDPAARPDIAAWCRMRGQELLGEETEADGAPTYRVRRLA